MQYGTTTFRQRTVFVIPFVGDGAPTSRLCFLNISICFYLLTQTTIKGQRFPLPFYRGLSEKICKEAKRRNSDCSDNETPFPSPSLCPQSRHFREGSSHFRFMRKCNKKRNHGKPWLLFLLNLWSE